jgi:two-component system, NarL family, response regulator LiaR
MKPIQIVLVDDHRLVARSLRAFLESWPDMRVVGIASSGEVLLAHVDEWNPDVILQDLLMPGGLDGIETTHRVLQRRPHVHVIALTASTDEARMMGVLRAGAQGYIRKDTDPEMLLTAIRAVAQGRTFIDPSVVNRTVVNEEDLTARELDVLRHIALGRSNHEIGEALHISNETVKTHVGNILSKLQVENRSQAIVQSLKRGLVRLDELP